MDAAITAERLPGRDGWIQVTIERQKVRRFNLTDSEAEQLRQLLGGLLGPVRKTRV